MPSITAMLDRAATTPLSKIRPWTTGQSLKIQISQISRPTTQD
jgi:hypothetical protein